MSSSNLIILYGLLSAAIITGGVQDWRTGEVSNWITMPLLALGTLASVLRLLTPTGFLIGFIEIAMTMAALNGWMGGADWKVLVGLFGLWPVAGFAALIGAGAWGLVEMIKTRNRNARFPGVSAFAVAVILTFLVQLFIIHFELT